MCLVFTPHWLYIIRTYQRAPGLRLNRFLTEIFEVLSHFFSLWWAMLLRMGCFHTLIPFSVFLRKPLSPSFLRIVKCRNAIVLTESSCLFRRFKPLIYSLTTTATINIDSSLSYHLEALLHLEGRSHHPCAPTITSRWNRSASSVHNCSGKLWV